MYQEFLNTSYKTEQIAREKAAQISMSNNSPWYIILTGEMYFITDTKNVQPYETLVACYLCGQNQQLPQSRR